jgi:hypothetical protein
MGRTIGGGTPLRRLRAALLRDAHPVKAILAVVPRAQALAGLLGWSIAAFSPSGRTRVFEADVIQTLGCRELPDVAVQIRLYYMLPIIVLAHFLIPNANHRACPPLGNLPCSASHYAKGPKFFPGEDNAISPVCRMASAIWSTE